MTYLCLIFTQPETTVAGRSGAGDHESFVHATREIGAHPAGCWETAVIVCVRDGEPSVIENRSLQTGGGSPEYALLEARDLNDAIRLASRLVVSGEGRLELRPMPVHGGGPDGGSSSAEGKQ